jgi:predicted membrane-bound mannosyltransferase
MTESLVRPRRLCVVAFAVCALYVAARLWHLTSECLDFDEIFSLNLARQDWSRLFSDAIQNVSHPPLFYILLKLWIGLGGQSLFWLRLGPVLISLASLLPFFLLCRELKLGALETCLALVLMAFNAYLISYAQYLRMFVLLQFASLWSLWLFVRFTQSPPQEVIRRSGWLLLANLALVYSHYWGWVLIGTELLYLLGWKREKLWSFVLALLPLGLCFLPWALAVSNAAAQRGDVFYLVTWISKPTLPELAYFYASLNGILPLRHSTLVSFLLFVAPVLLWGWYALRHSSQESPERGFLLWFLALFAFVPVLVTFVASWVLRNSVWAERQLIIVAVPYLLLVAVGANQLRRLGIRYAFVLLMIGWAATAGLVAMAKVHKTLAWDRVAAELARSEPASPAKVPIYVLEHYVGVPIEYNLELLDNHQFQVKRIDDLADVTQDHFWVAIRNLTWTEARSPQEILATKGYAVGEGFREETPSMTVSLFPVNKR